MHAAYAGSIRSAKHILVTRLHHRANVDEAIWPVSLSFVAIQSMPPGGRALMRLNATPAFCSRWPGNHAIARALAQPNERTVDV
jgi:hypothetical protein